MKMYALLSDQGTAAIETALCERCMGDPKMSKQARQQAEQSSLNDVPPDAPFRDCTENDALQCIGCGWAPNGEPTWAIV